MLVSRLTEALARHAMTIGERVAMSDSFRSLTWSKLAAWTGGIAEDLGSEPETVGIYGHNSVDWAAAFLAACAAGKTIVPVPAFFSSEQRAHIIRDAGIQRIIVTDAEAAADHTLPVPAYHLPESRAGTLPLDRVDGGLIIYTSGSTGTPKGVRLINGQALWSAEALAKAIGATAEDKYLSLLPLPTLLELICGIMIPVLVGGAVHFDRDAARNAGAGIASNIADAFERSRPTTSVLVPQLLGLYALQLMAAGKRPHKELRFVAVGGASIPPVLAQGARLLGIPVYEGYGLSECCSVVSVNRPDACREGTAGKPLPGLKVTIEDDEIVVEGPTIMDGYLHADAPPKKWQTGDVGSLDADGFLTVYGRRDNLIITPYGRNLSPEWIETILLGDPRLRACILAQPEEAGALSILLIPSPAGEAWFETASPEQILKHLAQALHTAPDYARPKRALVVDLAEAAANNLFTPNGRIRRKAAIKYLQAHIANSAAETRQKEVA
jgi:long-subunit acyl-CoA synthetase (AMP-forming)